MPGITVTSTPIALATDQVLGVIVGGRTGVTPDEATEGAIESCVKIVKEIHPDANLVVITHVNFHNDHLYRAVVVATAAKLPPNDKGSSGSVAGNGG